MRKYPLIGVCLFIVVLFSIGTQSNVVGYQQASNSPDFKFTHRFGVVSGTHGEIPYNNLKCEFINNGTTNISYLKIHGEGRLIMINVHFINWDTAWNLDVPIQPGQTGWCECFSLPTFNFIPRFINVHLCIRTDKEGDNHEDINYVNGTFLFWEDTIHFLHVIYSD